MLLPKDTMLYYFVSLRVVKVMTVEQLLVEDYVRVLTLRWSWFRQPRYRGSPHRTGC